jgi:hypothetical protein
MKVILIHPILKDEIKKNKNKKENKKQLTKSTRVNLSNSQHG